MKEGGRLQRDLMKLEHEDLPGLKCRAKDREERREERVGAREG